MFAGAETDQGIIDVGAVRAPIDLFGDLAFGTTQTPYASCAQADVPEGGWWTRMVDGIALWAR